MAERFDYIIIGGGSGGCAVANRLSANPDIPVLLIEAGTSAQPDIKGALDILRLWGSDVDWAYQTEPIPGLKNRTVIINRGKLLGGSYTLAAARMYVRGNRLDYDHWNYLGNKGWSYRDVLPYFKDAERFVNGASAYHGADGPMDVGFNPHPTPVASVYIEAARELGYAGPDWDYNGEKQEGSVGLWQHTVRPDGVLVETAESFIQPVMDRPNLTIYANTEATRLLIKEGRVVGVEFIREGRTEQVLASKEIILSGGTINSPKLLMLSGIGDRRHLQEVGVDVKVDLPGVGQNLQDHMLFFVFHRSKIELPEPFMFPEAGLWAYSRPGMEATPPDLQSFALANINSVTPPGLEGPNFFFAAYLMRPQSVGSVTLRSNRVEDPPRIAPNYLHSRRDYEALRRGLELSRELSRTSAFAVIDAGEFAPGLQATESEIADFIRSNATTGWHLVGTCKMGWDAMAVVDPQLRVHGLQGLRVADASIMPTIINGNPNATTIMIGLKAADMILDETNRLHA